MKGLGGLMFLFGAGSVVLNLMDREFRIFSWIDNWGTEVGWGIRIGLIVLGAGLWMAGSKPKKKSA